MPHFEIRLPSARSLPLIVHVPHASTVVPPEYRSSVALSDRGLASELLLMTDRYTDDLGGALTELGGTMFVNRVSRLVMDPERFPEDSNEPMARLGMGAVYVLRQDGSPLRRSDFSAENFEEFHGDALLFDRWSGSIRAAALDVAANTPFAGSLVPSRFYLRDGRVRSLMIELRRDLYMDEGTGENSSGFERTRALVRSLLMLAAERCAELAMRRKQ